MRMPDAGAQEVYCTNCTGGPGGGWEPDGGFIGIVTALVDFDGGWVSVGNTVTVTGAVTTGGLTDAELRASPVSVSGVGTFDVSAATLPLPAGAATEATLATRAADSTITARLNTLGQKTSANSAPVVLSSDQSAVPITDNGGSITVDGTVAATQSGTWNINNVSGTVSLPTGAATEATLVLTESSVSTRLADSTFTTRINTQGQKAMTASTPVVIASDQSAIPVTMTSTTITGSVAVTGPLTDTQLRATPVPVSGTVTANAGSSYGAAFPATGTAAGFSDGTNMRPGYAIDLDTSGGTIWGQGVQLVGQSFGAPQAVSVDTVPVNGFVGGLAVRQVPKTATNPLATSVSCTGTAAALPTSALAYRTSLCVTNNGSNVIYLGPAGVSTANGFPLPVGGYYCDDLATQVLYCISAGGTENVRVLEQ